MVAFKVISTDIKHFQSSQFSQKYFRNSWHFDVFVIISRHTPMLEGSEAV